MTTRLEGDVHITGALSANNIAPSDATVTNAKVASGAAIDADKIEHVHRYFTDFDDEFDVAPAADHEKIVFRARASGNIREFGALLIDTGSSTDVKFDLQKAAAGSTSFATVLSATVDFVHGDTDNSAKLGTVSSVTFIAGDVFRIDMDFTSATGAAGPLAWVEVDEAAA